MDVEHASDSEFSAWLTWNGISFTGSNEWTFDSKCAVINYVLSHGIRPRLMKEPERLLSDLFLYPEGEKGSLTKEV